jgi:hypothetical protein
MGRRVRVLVEVNVGGESSKTGVDPAGAAAVVEAVRREPGLTLVGLMTVPRYELEPEQAAVHFGRLRRLRDELGGAEVLPELSMGMSQDFEQAIEQGATMVRVGTAVFGERRTQR